jgi:hypothetical protein
VIIALCLLAAADLLRIDYKFMKLVNAKELLGGDSTLENLKKQKEKEIFRVFELPNAYPRLRNFMGVHGLESVVGFHDNELKWYREFRGGQGSENFIYKLRTGEINTNPFLNLMNVKYIIFRQPGKPVGSAVNSRYMPRAFIASGYEILAEDKIIERIKDSTFDYRNTVILQESVPGFTPDKRSDSSAGTALVEKYTPNGYVIKADLERPGFLVISDNYYPAWKASVNGTEQKIYRANYTIQAVPLESGSHTVEIFYSSRLFNLGRSITFLCLLIILGLSLFQVYRWNKARRSAA